MSNENSNGNGHTKAFELVPPKTPEEIRHESNRKIAPEIRRQVRQMKIPAQAKFLFDAILDDTFMYDFGGDGSGRMIASIRQLSERYGHDRDSIMKWAEMLAEKGQLWFERSWPFQEWRIIALCPAPEHKATLIQKIKAKASAKRAAAARSDNAEDTRKANFLAQNQKSPSKTDTDRTTERPVSPHNAEDTRTSGGTLPHIWRNPSAKSGGHLPPHMRKIPAHLADTYPPQEGNPSAQPAEVTGIVSAAQAVGSGQNRLLESSPDVRDQTIRPLSVQRLNAIKSRPLKDENSFLAEVAEQLSKWDPKWTKNELENHGAWWRTRYRKDPRKALMVLADIAGMIKEGKGFSKNPAAAAVDLWKRLP